MGLRERFEREDTAQLVQSTFDEFWRLYPRKEGKLDALKAWKQMTREYSPAEIIAGLTLNLDGIKRKERKFQKLPGGWLRDGRWMDEPDYSVSHTGNGLLDALGRVTVQ